MIFNLLYFNFYGVLEQKTFYISLSYNYFNQIVCILKFLLHFYYSCDAYYKIDNFYIINYT